MKKFLLSIFAVLFAFAGAQAQTWTKVTDASTLKAGDEIVIVASDYNYALSTTQNKNNRAQVSVTKDGSNVTFSSSDVQVLTLEDGNKNGTFAFNTGSGYLYAASSNSNYLRTETTLSDNSSWTISIAGDAATVTAQGTNTRNVMQYNNASSLFSCYASATQKAISIYKYTTDGEGGGETPEPEEPVVPEEPETPEDGIVWNLVEDVNDIKDGDEVIIVADGYDVALGALSGSYHTSTPVTVSEKKLTNTGDAIVLTVGKNGDYYTFSYDSEYLNWTSGNSLNTATTIRDNTSFSIEITEGVTIISNVAGVSEGRVLQYNASSPRFACYKGTQQDVCIYKKTESLYHTLTVTDAGWATLYLAVSARIPSTVEAYTVTAVNSGWVELNQVTGVIPANTGIIVKADAGEYKFFMGETVTAEVTGNLLEGTLFNKNIDEEAYVLSKVGDVVGLYKAEMTDGAWLNNANKAFLPANALTPAQQTVAFYGFEWGGTTGIDEITDNREQSTVIFDLSGRRIENITAPGIYIVNGKKLLVK